MTLLVDGVRQVKASEITVNGQSGAQAVETLEGLVGKTPGSKRLEISAKWALPITGMEFDVATATANGTYHEIQIPVGSKTIVSQGWFQEFNLGGSVNANTEVGAQFVGSLDAPE